jgi:TolA-binding protein
MKTDDTIIVDEILAILKLAQYPSWSHPIALDRRDTALYIRQIVDKFGEVNIEALEEAEDEIKGMELSIRELDDEIESLKIENLSLEKENRSLHTKPKEMAKMADKVIKTSRKRNKKIVITGPSITVNEKIYGISAMQTTYDSAMKLPSKEQVQEVCTQAYMALLKLFTDNNHTQEKEDKESPQPGLATKSGIV